MRRLANVVIESPASTITLPVVDAKLDDVYILTGADGLGPPDINVALGHSVYRGGVFQGSIPGDREIVFLVELNPNYYAFEAKPVSELRAEFYKLISGPDPITLVFNMTPSESWEVGPATVIAKGYIRRIETVPFAKRPQVQLTFTCPSPTLDAMDYTNIPFTPNDPVSTPFNFEYLGSAIAGFEFNFELRSAPSKVIVKAFANNGVVETITIPGPRKSGEFFNINTSSTGRKITYSYPPSPSLDGDITGMCTITSGRWPSVRPGANTIQVFDGSNAPLAVVTSRLRYTAKYWGI